MPASECSAAAAQRGSVLALWSRMRRRQRTAGAQLLRRFVFVQREEGLRWVEATYLSGIWHRCLSSRSSTTVFDLEKLVTAFVEQSSGDPHHGGDENLEFLVVAFDPKTSLPYATLRGEDIYRTTAKIAVEAARRVLTLDLPKRGFVGAADLFDVPEFLEAIGVEIVAAK